jgi:hypothetical protein
MELIDIVVIATVINFVRIIVESFVCSMYRLEKFLLGMRCNIHGIHDMFQVFLIFLAI